MPGRTGAACADWLEAPEPDALEELLEAGAEVGTC